MWYDHNSKKPSVELNRQKAFYDMMLGSKLYN